MILFSSFAQNTITTAGYEANGDGSISATIGQIFFLETNGNGHISNGVQQAYIISVETGIEITNIQLSVYPNPTNDVLYLHIDDEKISTVTYTLFNYESKPLTKGIANDSETQIFMGKYNTGIYILDVISDGKSVKRFKIIKN